MPRVRVRQLPQARPEAAHSGPFREHKARLLRRAAVARGRVRRRRPRRGVHVEWRAEGRRVLASVQQARRAAQALEEQQEHVRARCTGDREDTSQA